MSGHEIVWEFDGDCTRGRAVCHEPEGANCRLTGGPDCYCEEWSIERDADGTPYHLVTGFDGDVRHENVPANYCNVVEYLEADYCIEELCADRYAAFEIGRTAIEPRWTGDGYGWVATP